MNEGYGSYLTIYNKMDERSREYRRYSILDELNMNESNKHFSRFRNV